MINNYIYLRIFLLLSLLYACSFPAVQQNITNAKSSQDTMIIKQADPTILYHKGTYYLYGTGGYVNRGFRVYQSTDLLWWKGPAGASDGYALMKGDAYGTKGFWAPHVVYYNSKFFMFYTADENIAIAESTSPLGPFTQKEHKKLSGAGKQIDPFVFFDDDGKKYLYHVRLSKGNRIYVAQLKDDLSDIKVETVQECLSAEGGWENTSHSNWPVAEGPTVIKHKGIYYLFYSANDFRNKNYAVGYATSISPYGPWKKYKNNPIISRRRVRANGPGHGDFVKVQDGALYYVLHTHASDTAVHQRKTAIIKGEFITDGKEADKMEMDKKSFQFLHLKK